MAGDDDVYGALIADLLRGRPAYEIVERDDGFVAAYDARYLLAPFRAWEDPLERRALRFVRGRVLDVACGAGRVCLHLQARGLTVVGIDSSPGAIGCCRSRGVHDARQMALDEIDDSLGTFDTIVFMGQTLGLLGSPARGRGILVRLARIARPDGRIVADGYDPHSSEEPADVRYRERNLRRGRPPGQHRARIRRRDLATPWRDWLQLAPHELALLLDGTGWRLARTLGTGPGYLAIVERTPAER